ncbi:hypothetical protein [Streptomyces sp. NPDC058045]|uniref:hypothetical protein n=1 Tax=Streptomyces sp. NPDC058045 TaxID=3346311 RepID=UPI0036E03FA2
MICARCHGSILEDQPYRTHHHEAGSGPGCTNYSHADPGDCPPLAALDLRVQRAAHERQ